MTASVVSPWLAACGPSQMRWLRMYGREFLNVLRVDLGALALEQRPDLGEASPADDRARRGAEIDAALDELGRRPGQPVRVRVVGSRGRHQPLDVLAEPFVQEHLLGDARAQLDDPFLRHQLVQAHALEVEVHELLFLFGRQIADVDHDREAIGRGFRQREGALAELDRVHRRDREAERRQLVGFLADRDRAILQRLRGTRSATSAGCG